MATAAELIEPRVDPPTDQTRIDACRTVAAYATDDDDREMLLKMLGLNNTVTDRKRPAAKRRAPHPECPYGHRLRRIDQSCTTCKEYVPITELRMLVDRIIAETGQKTTPRSPGKRSSSPAASRDHCEPVTVSGEAPTPPCCEWPSS